MTFGIGQNAFDILLRFLIDKQALLDVKAGTKTLDEALEGVGASQDLVTLAAKRLQPILDEQTRATARLQNEWWKTQRVMRATAFVFNQAAIAGLGIITPLVGLAAKYVSEMEKLGEASDPVAQRMLAAQAQLKDASLSIGRSAAEVMLPVYERVADIVESAAKFVEDNPDALETALKVGAALVSFGMLGRMVANGIKLVIDVKFVWASIQNFLAARAMEQAAQKNLLAAAAFQKVGWTGAAQAAVNNTGAITAAGAAATAALNTAMIAGLTVVAPVIGSLIGKEVGNWLGRSVYGEGYKNQQLGHAGQTAFRMASLPGQGLTLLLRDLGVISDETAGTVGRVIKSFDDFIAKLFKLDEGAEDATQAVEKLVTSLRGHEKEAEIVAAYTKMREGDLEAERKYVDDVAKIREDGRRREIEIWGGMVSALRKIADQLKDRLAKLAADLQAQDAKAHADYHESRRTITKQAQRSIEEMWERHRERLYRMQLEHDRRIEQLVGDRDALGIVEEDRRYQQEVELANREFALELARRRQETIERIHELDRQYALERERRHAEYAERVKEEKAKAAADMAERRRQAMAELQAAREQRNRKLRDLQEEFNAERLRRREAFLETVRQIDAALLGEQRIRQLYYNRMLADAEAFLAEYRRRLPGGGTRNAPHKADGGYVSGLIQTGERGPEYLMDNATVRAVENGIGAAITRQRLLSAVLGGGRQQQIIHVHMSTGATLLQVRREIAQHQNAFAAGLREMLNA